MPPSGWPSRSHGGASPARARAARRADSRAAGAAPARRGCDRLEPGCDASPSVTATTSRRPPSSAAAGRPRRAPRRRGAARRPAAAGPAAVERRPSGQRRRPARPASGASAVPAPTSIRVTSRRRLRPPGRAERGPGRASAWLWRRYTVRSATRRAWSASRHSGPAPSARPTRCEDLGGGRPRRSARTREAPAGRAVGGRVGVDLGRPRCAGGRARESSGVDRAEVGQRRAGRSRSRAAASSEAADADRAAVPAGGHADRRRARSRGGPGSRRARRPAPARRRGRTGPSRLSLAAMPTAGHVPSTGAHPGRRSAAGRGGGRPAPWAVTSACVQLLRARSTTAGRRRAPAVAVGGGPSAEAGAGRPDAQRSSAGGRRVARARRGSPARRGGPRRAGPGRGRPRRAPAAPPTAWRSGRRRAGEGPASPTPPPARTGRPRAGGARAACGLLFDGAGDVSRPIPTICQGKPSHIARPASLRPK